MSAAKMVADSTQADVPEMSSTKKRKKMVQKKKVKKKKESTKKNKKKVQAEAWFDDSDLDLDKEMHPIGYYVKDRENLLSEMFHCVKGQSLNRALPDVLKEVPFEDLRRRCMEQLEVMSKKRIRRILAGDDPASISSSSTEDETSDEEIAEIEEGQVNEVDSEDSQVVDSTSYTLEVGDSDRDIDDGSVGHSSPYGNHSDEEQGYIQQDEDMYEADDASDHDVAMETDFVENPPDSEPAYPPGSPEEGEVIDDNSDGGEVNTNDSIKANVKQVTGPVDKTEDNSKEGEGDTNTSQNKKEICDENIECEVVEDDAKRGEETILTDKLDKDTKLINVDKKTDDDSNDKETDKSDETTENVGVDVRIVKKEIRDSDDENSTAVTDEKDGIEKNDVDMKKLDDVKTEEDNVDVEPVESERDLSDEGEVLEESAKDTAKAGCSKSEVIVSDVKKGKPARRVVKPPKQDIAPALTRNQMELLELEMRARAIKAMLKTAK